MSIHKTSKMVRVSVRITRLAKVRAVMPLPQYCV